MIRKLKKDDFEVIIHIWLEVNIKAHNFISDEYWRKQLETVKELLPQSEVYVYENGKILGFVGLTDNYIAGIFVLSNEQSKGIGKQLLDYIKDLKSELSLSVYQKNRRAVEFYQRENFVIQSENVDENTGEKQFLMSWKRNV
ncbi:putative acetyltransferase [Virgibacillus halotolerans]|uniref:N-acetyltransferase n=1 Tax=Virgibacillus halotolerans TaxID=1071053 RepID=UPI00196081DA|nr:N-acetyltransferase [Virgibacillus halotolerans]MBM7601519.1 putative acetyltransferase [Virgibacillus halotolerans]